MGKLIEEGNANKDDTSDDVNKQNNAERTAQMESTPHEIVQNEGQAPPGEENPVAQKTIKSSKRNKKSGKRGKKKKEDTESVGRVGTPEIQVQNEHDSLNTKDHETAASAASFLTSGAGKRRPQGVEDERFDGILEHNIKSGEDAAAHPDVEYFNGSPRSSTRKKTGNKGSKSASGQPQRKTRALSMPKRNPDTGAMLQAGRKSKFSERNSDQSPKAISVNQSQQ